MRKLLSVVVVLFLALGLAACGDDDDSGTVSSDKGGSSEEANTVAVATKDFAFSPVKATAKAGEVYFAITNKDDTKHTFTIDGTKVDIALDPMGTGKAEADLDAGTYSWHCKIHSSMKGTLTVS